MEKEKPDIFGAIESVCKSKKLRNDYLVILRETFDHVSKYVNEPRNQRAESVKRVIDKNWKGSDAK